MPQIMLIDCSVNLRDDGCEEVYDQFVYLVSEWEEVTDVELKEIESFIYQYNNNHPARTYLMMKRIPVQMFEIRAKIAEEKDRLQKKKQEEDERRVKEAFKREKEKREQEEKRRINKIANAKKILAELKDESIPL